MNEATMPLRLWYANDSMRIELDKNIERSKELEYLLEVSEEAPVLLHPNMAGRYQETVGELVEVLNQEDHRTESTEHLRSLIDRIVLTPNADKTGLEITLQGDIAGILSIAVNGGKPLDTQNFS